MSDRAEDSFESSAAGESTSKLTPLAGLLYLPLWHQGLQFLGQTARGHPELLKVTQKSLLFEVPQPCCFLPQSHCRNKESSKMGVHPFILLHAVKYHHHTDMYVISQIVCQLGLWSFIFVREKLILVNNRPLWPEDVCAGSPAWGQEVKSEKRAENINQQVFHLLESLQKYSKVLGYL